MICCLGISHVTSIIVVPFLVSPLPMVLRAVPNDDGHIVDFPSQLRSAHRQIHPLHHHLIEIIIIKQKHIMIKFGKNHHVYEGVNMNSAVIIQSALTSCVFKWICVVVKCIRVIIFVIGQWFLFDETVG